MVPEALAAEGLRGAAVYRKAVAELRHEMEKQTRPDKTVAERAKAAAAALDPMLKELGQAGKPLNVPALFRTVARSGEKAAAESWDNAAQYYLALAALHNAWKDTRQAPPPKGVRPALLDLAEQLPFPPGYDSPRNFDPGKIRPQVNRLLQSVK
jgi:hypothetical protein